MISCGDATTHDANATQLCECGCSVARGATIDTINASIAHGVSAAEPVVFALADGDNATSVWSGASSDDAVDAADVATDEHSTSGAADASLGESIQSGNATNFDVDASPSTFQQ